jgi:hypothetical protein
MHTGVMSRSNTSALCVSYVHGVAPQDSPQSGTEVKNGWNYTSTPPIQDHSMDRDNFAFFRSMDNLSVLYTYCVLKRSFH